MPGAQSDAKLYQSGPSITLLLLSYELLLWATVLGILVVATIVLCEVAKPDNCRAYSSVVVDGWVYKTYTLTKNGKHH